MGAKKRSQGARQRAARKQAQNERMRAELVDAMTGLAIPRAPAKEWISTDAELVRTDLQRLVRHMQALPEYGLQADHPDATTNVAEMIRFLAVALDCPTPVSDGYLRKIAKGALGILRAQAATLSRSPTAKRARSM